MNRRRSALTGLVLATLAAVLAAVCCWMVLGLFPERFARGATLSGLNPDGGGPGFLLLLTAGILSLIARTEWTRSLSVRAAVVEAATLAALCGVVLGSLLSLVPPSGLAVEPIVSGVVAAFFVPRVCASVVQLIWRDAEGVDAPGTSSPVPEPVKETSRADS
jgi:FtsH-binding integral membrane protein